METKNQDKNTQSDRRYYALAFRAVTDFGVTIAVPAIIAAYFGKRLDDRFDTSPWILIVLLALAFLITTVIIVKKAQEYARIFNEDQKK